MVKIITVDGKQIPMKATAGTPRLYRIKFKRDIFKDMQQLQTAISTDPDDADSEKSEIALDDLTLFENVAYIMAMQADFDENGNRLGNVPKTAEEWLDGFDGVFSIYEALPQIIEMWGDNIVTTSTAKKKQGK